MTNFIACNIQPWRGTPQKIVPANSLPRTNQKIPQKGIKPPAEYIETVREEFPGLPLAAISTYWQYGAIASEIRTHLEKVSSP